MFVDTLTEAQKLLLVQVLCEVAQADQIVKAEERELIARYAVSVGLEAEQIQAALEHAQLVPAEQLADLPESAKRVMLIEAQTLAMTDGDYGPDEQAIIAGLANRLALEPEVIEQINAYVQRGFAWVHEGMNLVLERPAAQAKLAVA